MITSENVANRSEIFAQIMYQRSAWFQTNLLLVPFGSDFHYFDPPIEFDSIQFLFLMYDSVP